MKIANTNHILEIKMVHYCNIVNGIKDFEVRRNKDYKVGDTIKFKMVSGMELQGLWNIKYLHGNGYGMKKNFVILGIERIV